MTEIQMKVFNSLCYYGSWMICVIGKWDIYHSWGYNNSTSFLSFPLKWFSALEKSFSTIHKMLRFIHFTALLLLWNRIFSLYFPLLLVQNITFLPSRDTCFLLKDHQPFSTEVGITLKIIRTFNKTIKEKTVEHPWMNCSWLSSDS